MRVAVLQSNYIPWKGYFDIIGKVDVFVFHDDVQYTKGDWRNRNRIKSPTGTEWLTIPCGTREDRRICDVSLPDPKWQRRHLERLLFNYRDAPFLSDLAPFLDWLYRERSWRNLSELNQTVIESISREFLGISTEFMDSRSFELAQTKQHRLMSLLRQVGATVYLSGPAGRNYLAPEAFESAGIGLEWMDYSGYREYPQSHPPFVHEVSILDLLLHVGGSVRDFLLHPAPPGRTT